MTAAPPKAAAAPGASDILSLIRAGDAITRPQLVELTGLSKSAVAARVEDLLARNLVVRGTVSVSTGGRPPASLHFNRRAGYVLVADCGASRITLGIADLGGEIVARHSERVDVGSGPDAVLSWLETAFGQLRDSAGIDASSIRGVGVGLPGPVEHATGRPVRPPIMPGWDQYPVSERLANSFGVPTLVDNDVNLMALGEHRVGYPEAANFLFVKVSTGIGCGIILDGQIHRGAHGAAGDIGHVYVPGHDDVVCACGNVGCVEAVASGRAVAARLADIDPQQDPVRQVVERALHGHADAVALVREAGREIGSVLAMLVNSFDPDVVVLGGQLAEVEQPLLAGVREVVYRRSLPLATHDLRIERSRLGEASGVTGAALMIVDHLLALA